ncbi:MAG: DNA/RNA non-specific endonuclease, partial [Deltaproteobacteria bacterium]
DDKFGSLPLPDLWGSFNEPGPVHDNILAAISSVGRIELPGQSEIPYGGTAFVVSDTLIMTNRHVAELFAVGLGRRGLSFRPGSRADWDFKKEYQRPDDPASTIHVKDVVMIHPYWDMALLRVDRLPARHGKLKLSTKSPEELLGKNVAVIGYPARDSRSDLRVQDEVFGRVYRVKRLQPGKIGPREPIESFGRYIDAVTHDSSTLGGNSGSMVLDVETGEVVALHFAGEYLKANYGVPTYELARDPRVVEKGVNFIGEVPATDEFDEAWDSAEGTEGAGRPRPIATAGAGVQSPAPAAAPAANPPPAGAPLALGDVCRWVIPVEVTVRCGSPQRQHDGAPGAGAGTPSASLAAPPAAAGMVAEAVSIDPDYSNREGYDPKFLGTRSRMIPLPALSDEQRKELATFDGPDGEDSELRYHHFSVALNARRRLAFFTAVNIDGTQMRKPKRERDVWIRDPRVPAHAQIGNEFYCKPFDRGHLVRRIDPAWGRSLRVSKAANDDTFHFTNCSPQHERFNEGKNLWAGLEDYVMQQADEEDRRVTVFTGPIFDDDDPVYEGVQIPREFWKVMVYVKPDGDLSATGFVVSQKDLVRALVEEMPADAVARLYQVPIREVASRTGLDFGRLPQFDPYPQQEGLEIRKPLESLDQIRF